MKKTTAIILAIFMFCVVSQPVWADGAVHPLVAHTEQEYVQTEHEFINILLLGIDHLNAYYSGGMTKRDYESNHTDAIMLVAVDLTDRDVHLISIPRDTPVYVPGVFGVYKINGAYNTATEMADRLNRTRDAVSWLLGNIRIDHYVAVEPEALIVLGDAIGGVDYDLEMSYQGGYRYYEKGYQHLDGKGIMDYARSRTKATVNADDLGRTDRQRNMARVVLNKIVQEPSLIYTLLDTIQAQMDQTLYTDLTVMDMLLLMPTVLGLDVNNINSLVLSGEITMAMGTLNQGGWNFNFIDQDHRLDIIRTVFGIQAEKLPWVSRGYLNWLKKEGFEAARALRIAERVMAWADTLNLTEAQSAELTALQKAYEELQAAFNAVSDKLESGARNTLTRKQGALKKAANALIASTEYPETVSWTSQADFWYDDELINEYQYDWR